MLAMEPAIPSLDALMPVSVRPNRLLRALRIWVNAHDLTGLMGIYGPL
jgi:hypothetical protein